MASHGDKRSEEGRIMIAYWITSFVLTLLLSIIAIRHYKKRCNPLTTNCRRCRHYSIFCYAESGAGYLCKATEQLPDRMSLCSEINDGKCKLFKPSLIGLCS